MIKSASPWVDPPARREPNPHLTAIAHLREVLGDAGYESRARAGQAMTTAAIATYAYQQIDQVRAELEQPELSRREKSG
jgi:hypothetical protein